MRIFYFFVKIRYNLHGLTSKKWSYTVSFKPSIIIVSGIDQARTRATNALGKELGDRFRVGKPLKDQQFTYAVSREVASKKLSHEVASIMLMGSLLHYAQTILQKATPEKPVVLNRWVDFVLAKHLAAPAENVLGKMNRNQLDALYAILRDIEECLKGKQRLYLYARVNPGDIHEKEVPAFDDEGYRNFWSRNAVQERLIAGSLDSYFDSIRKDGTHLVYDINARQPFDKMIKEMACFTRVHF